MSFKINFKNNVFEVDSSDVTKDDRLLVVLDNGDTLQLHSLPTRYIGDERYTKHYMHADAPNKPQLWVDDRAAMPRRLETVDQTRREWHGNLGFALHSDLVLNQPLELDLMRIFLYDSDLDFPVFEVVQLDNVVIAVHPVSVAAKAKNPARYHNTHTGF